MFRRTKVGTAVMLALGGSLVAGALPALAQDAAPQRVEITGSAIRRIDAESALPVQVLKAEDIRRSGATSVVDLLQKLPTIQGSTGEAAAVGGSTGGFAGVSIHNVGETRTLVLLNGHRLAQFGGQTLTGFAAAVDLNSLPLSAIERVDILTDGASALYGADAVAGVINFITKRDSSEGDVTAGFSSPEAGGAREWRISATKGFGSLSEDGYNVMFTVSHDERSKLRSKDRDFGKSGQKVFTYNGQTYRHLQTSVSPIPANAIDDLGQLVSPYLLANGSCPDNTYRITLPYNDGSGLVDDYCGYNFVGDLEIYPERKRDNFFGSARKQLGNHQLFADVLFTRTNQTSRIAPVPGSIAIPAGSPLHNQYLLPVGITQDTLALYRLFDLGQRTNDDDADFLDVAVGAEGSLLGWEYNATLTHSKSESKSNIAGYPGALAVRRLRTSGLLDPFVGPGQQSQAANEAIAATNYKGYWDGGTSTLDSVALRGQRELAKLPAGAMSLATGVNYQREKFASKPSLFAQGLLSDPVAGTLCDPVNAPDQCDQRFGDAAASPPYSASRNAYGVFGELLIPAMKGLEFTAALRYDHYSDFGNATTAKGAFRWSPTKQVLVRGSVGTGFRAPTVPQVNASLRPYGVTSDNYTCSAEMAQVAASLGAVCQPGNRQYDQIAGGNANLKPEKSRQATLGIRLEPTPSVSVGADLWHVAIRDTIGQLTEAEVFAHPLTYSSSWTTQVELGTGTRYLAFLADNKNLGKSYATGLDLDATGRFKTGVGDLTSDFKLTYMIREKSQLVPNGEYYSAIGNNAELGAVTFRWQGQWTNALRTGNWTHAFTLKFKSGYKDQEVAADRIDANGNVIAFGEPVRLDVGNHFTLDWQTQWALAKNMTLTVGALNVADTDPPMSLATGGANKGHPYGYDERYYDPRGRTWYANFSYKF